MPTPTSRARRTAFVLAGLGLALTATAAPALAAVGDPSYQLARLTCVGDDVQGTVQASADGTTPLRIALVARFGKGPYRGTGLAVDLLPVPTAASYSFSFNVAALPPGATDYRIEASVEGGKAKKSKKLSDDACAPGAVVPEVPVAVLLPLSLAATTALVLHRRGRLPSVP